MASVMGRRGMTTDRLLTSIFGIGDVNVDKIARSSAEVSSARSALITASYVDESIDQAAAKSSLFSQNYVSPTYETLDSDIRRWIISGGTRVSTNNDDLHITTSGTAVLRVPAGRLSVAGEYILGLKGYISPTASVGISLGTNTVATYSGLDTFSELNLSTILDITEPNVDITITIENGLNSYLYSPVYLCSSSSLLSYYLNAQLKNIFAAGGTVTFADLIEYVRINAIPTSDKRFLVRGNTTIPVKTMIIKNNTGDHVELPIYLQSRMVSDSHGPSAPIGQMGQFIYPNDETIPPLFSGQSLSADIVNTGFGYKFHTTTHVNSIVVTVSKSGIYLISSTKNGTTNTQQVTLIMNTPSTILINEDTQLISMKSNSTISSPVVVTMDIETSIPERLSVVSGVQTQAVDRVVSGNYPIDITSVPQDVWYPLVVDTTGRPSVLTAPFIIASYHYDTFSGCAPAIEWISRSVESEYLLQYATAFADDTTKSITLHKQSTIVGVSVSFPTIGSYVVTVTVDGVPEQHTISSVIPLSTIPIPMSTIGELVEFSVVDTSNNTVSAFYPNVYLEAIWYDDRSNMWSDGVDRVVMGYIRIADQIQFYPRGGNTVQGSRIFSGFESAIIPDPDTGICSRYNNISLSPSMILR